MAACLREEGGEKAGPVALLNIGRSKRSMIKHPVYIFDYIFIIISVFPVHMDTCTWLCCHQAGWAVVNVLGCDIARDWHFLKGGGLCDIFAAPPLQKI